VRILRRRLTQRRGLPTSATKLPSSGDGFFVVTSAGMTVGILLDLVTERDVRQKKLSDDNVKHQRSYYEKEFLLFYVRNDC
jgi:hypothetical protein